ncbi:MAG: replication initiator protein A [Syntrophorhabdus sp.]
MPKQGRLFSEQSGLTEITGKDEMNLAEYPICLLSRKPIPGIHTIEYREGNTSWKITGNAEHGLPLGGDQDIYVAIMETWKQNRFSSNKIEFGSVFQLLKRLGMPTSKQYYERFKQAVKRLAGLTIYAENSFYDHQGRKYDTIRGFHLFEDFRFSTRKSKHTPTSEEPNGYIRASDVLWVSVKNGYIKNINLAFYSRLSSPCVKRIYRFLDKKRFVSDRFRMGLINFAKKMGLMAGSTKCYPSHIKKDLTPAFRELREAGFWRRRECCVCISAK